MNKSPRLRSGFPGYALALFILLIISGCTMLPSEKELHYGPGAALDVETATRLAARAMISIDFIPQKQNDAAGFVQGVKNETDFLGFHMGFYLVVTASKDAGGQVIIQVKSQAGGEVAMSDRPGVYLEQFLNAYEPLIRRKLEQQEQPGHYKVGDEYAL